MVCRCAAHVHAFFHTCQRRSLAIVWRRTRPRAQPPSTSTGASVHAPGAGPTGSCTGSFSTGTGTASAAITSSSVPVPRCVPKPHRQAWQPWHRSEALLPLMPAPQCLRHTTRRRRQWPPPRTPCLHQRDGHAAQVQARRPLQSGSRAWRSSCSGDPRASSQTPSWSLQRGTSGSTSSERGRCRERATRGTEHQLDARVHGQMHCLVKKCMASACLSVMLLPALQQRRVRHVLLVAPHASAFSWHVPCVHPCARPPTTRMQPSAHAQRALWSARDAFTKTPFIVSPSTVGGQNSAS